MKWLMLKFVENLCWIDVKNWGTSHSKFLILKQFSASRSLDGTLCLLVLGSSMSVQNAISIV